MYETYHSLLSGCDEGVMCHGRVTESVDLPFTRESGDVFQNFLLNSSIISTSLQVIGDIPPRGLYQTCILSFDSSTNTVVWC